MVANCGIDGCGALCNREKPMTTSDLYRTKGDALRETRVPDDDNPVVRIPCLFESG